MPPVADYACLSKKCRTEEGESPVYELPLGSIRCPKCGSRRVQRLYNSPPMVNSDATKKLDGFTRRPLEQAETLRSETAEAVRAKRAEPAIAVDPRKIAEHLTRFGFNQTAAAAIQGQVNQLAGRRSDYRKGEVGAPTSGPIAGATTPAVERVYDPRDGRRG